MEPQQETPPPPPPPILVLAGRLFDPRTRELVRDQAVAVDPRSGLVCDVRPLSEDDLDRVRAGARGVVDLRTATVLPGLVDAHVHFFLHPYAETSWNDQLTTEPLVERTVRAVNHARVTLLAGFTTVRDLGTEGAEDADLALRRCLSGAGALAPGPRYFCANRAVVPTGSYGPKGNLRVGEEGVQGIRGAEVADGVDECRKAVRRQIGAGADWIKIYADYRYRSRVADVSVRQSKANIATFQPDELQALIDTAHQCGAKVAAHASTPEAVRAVVDLGVDSVEHGHGIADAALFAHMAQRGTTWVPTLGAYYTLGRAPPADAWAGAQAAFALARASGVRIACGGDTGVFAHGDNALELRLMVRLGADWRDVLRGATLGGWECVRSAEWEGARGAARLRGVAEMREGRAEVGDNEMPFGVLARGFSADLVATTGDLEADFEAAVSPGSISFVMKAGKVYKKDGLPVY